MENRMRDRSGEAGFSIIESLIAAALLLIVVVGVLPLFTRSMLNNVRGNDSTRQSNGAIDTFERGKGSDFNSGYMTVPDGATEAVETTVMGIRHLPSGDAASTTWEPAAAIPAADVFARRVRTLRQYSFDDFQVDDSFDDPLPGDAEDRLVYYKVVEVRIEDPVNDPLNLRPRFTVRSVRSY